MKIGVVGTGMVGSAAAYACVMRGIGREIVLIDKNKQRALAEADDIFHAVPFANEMILGDGDYPALKGCKAVIVAAGVNQKPGETRLQLLERNAAVFREVIPAILNAEPNAILVIATNPVDVMTHLSARIATRHGVAPGRVFGSGTTLDTARFRALLARALGVDTNHVHAYVVGEHGDSEVLAWSQVIIGGHPLEDYCALRGIELGEAKRAEIDEGVRRAAYHIIEGKGATYYGIGSALARIMQVILGDQRSILTICAPSDEIAGVKDVTVAMPHLFGSDGVIQRLPMTLAANEEAALARSAGIVRHAIDVLG
jgi:L-lactate dehydrogenase